LIGLDFLTLASMRARGRAPCTLRRQVESLARLGSVREQPQRVLALRRDRPSRRSLDAGEPAWQRTTRTPISPRGAFSRSVQDALQAWRSLLRASLTCAPRGTALQQEKDMGTDDATRDRRPTDPDATTSGNEAVYPGPADLAEGQGTTERERPRQEEFASYAQLARAGRGDSAPDEPSLQDSMAKALLNGLHWRRPERVVQTAASDGAAAAAHQAVHAPYQPAHTPNPEPLVVLSASVDEPSPAAAAGRVTPSYPLAGTAGFGSAIDAGATESSNDTLNDTANEVLTGQEPPVQRRALSVRSLSLAAAAVLLLLAIGVAAFRSVLAKPATSAPLPGPEQREVPVVPLPSSKGSSIEPSATAESSSSPAPVHMASPAIAATEPPPSPGPPEPHRIEPRPRPRPQPSSSAPRTLLPRTRGSAPAPSVPDDPDSFPTR
jgi:hypothetical protein